MASNKDKLKDAIKKAQYASLEAEPGPTALVDKIMDKLPPDMRDRAAGATAKAVLKLTQILKGFGASGMDKLRPITPLELMTMLKLSSDKKATMVKKIEGKAKLIGGEGKREKLDKALDEAIARLARERRK